MSDSWLGHDSIALTLGRMRLVVVPDRGGKVVSLIGPDGVEWLSQAAPGHAQDGGFTDAEMCGWDECSPTINACIIDGREYRDHGDLWDAAWRVIDHSEASLALEAEGRDVALRFQRRIELRADCVVVAYRVESREEQGQPFLWAWHPQFAVDDSAWVELPGMRRVVETFDSEQREVAWEGTVGLPPRGKHRKIWTSRNETAAAAILHRSDGGSLMLTWEGDAVRWVGVWLDHAAFAPGPVIALEPSTGWFDDAARAVHNGCVAILDPGEALAWTLCLRFG